MKLNLGLVSLHVLALSFATSAYADTGVDGQQRNSESAAPDSAADAADGDIIVTARRRNETSLQAPVVLSAISGEQMQRLNITSLVDVAKLTPGLVLGTASGSYGGIIGLRGASQPTSNAASEGAVTITMDGVPVSNGQIVRLSAFDIDQVEVLKGPQALFFGKNSSGGIISLRSAEPTSVYKSQISAGYEFNARQADITGYISGPLAEGLTGRIAGLFTRSRGYFTNVAVNPAYNYAPGLDQEAIRVSLNFEPNDAFTWKVRGTYHHVHENGAYSSNQKFACRTPGVPQIGGAGTASDTDCTADDFSAAGAIPSAAIRAVTGNPEWDQDQNRFDAKQLLLSSDLQYQLTDSITLNAITGYYHVKQSSMDSAGQGSKFYIADMSGVNKSTFSQEVRLSYRSPDVPINLMLGGFFQDDKLTFHQQVVLNAAAGFPSTPVIVKLSEPWIFPTHNKTYSAFGQVGWDITKQFSLSAGVRYSEDRKRLDLTPPLGLPNKIARPSRTFGNWSPEITLAFKPNDDVNLFGSYKQGFKAGAYNLASTTVDPLTKNAAITSFDISYEPETAKGFEVGLKARLADRQVRINLAAYSYLYSNLQLSRVDEATKALFVLNGSSARIKGVEGDFVFSPNGVPGLSITGAAAYNSARYNSSFLGPCYTGMTSTQGCLPTVIGGATVLAQQFNGRPLPRAPEFSGSFGFNYETDVSDNWNVGINANGVYTSKQYLSQELSPIGFSPSRLLLDAGLSFSTKSKSMTFQVIGRNLTDKHFGVTANGSFGTGVSSTTGTATGIISDYEGPVSRGREIWLKVTIRPSEF
jgi:iron complex outermembrane receptor protein